MPFAAIGMDLEIILVSEISQTGQTEKHHITPICGIYQKKKKKDTNELRNRFIDFENKN